MTPRARKRLFDILRVAVCVIALWIVIRGVTLYDHVVLTDGKTDLVGDVLRAGDQVEIRLLSGETRLVSRVEVVTDEDNIASGCIKIIPQRTLINIIGKTTAI